MAWMKDWLEAALWRTHEHKQTAQGSIEKLCDIALHSHHRMNEVYVYKITSIW